MGPQARREKACRRDRVAGEEGPRHAFAVDGERESAAERRAHQRATVDPRDEIGEVCTHRSRRVAAGELLLQRGE